MTQSIRKATRWKIDAESVPEIHGREGGYLELQVVVQGHMKWSDCYAFLMDTEAELFPVPHAAWDSVLRLVPIAWSSNPNWGEV